MFYTSQAVGKLLTMLCEARISFLSEGYGDDEGRLVPLFFQIAVLSQVPLLFQIVFIWVVREVTGKFLF